MIWQPGRRAWSPFLSAIGFCHEQRNEIREVGAPHASWSAARSLDQMSHAALKQLLHRNAQHYAMSAVGQ
jgi:hypothetical protein